MGRNKRAELWAPETVAQIRELAEQHKSDSEIGRIVGAASVTIKRIRDENGIAPGVIQRYRRPDFQAQVRELWEQKKASMDIANELHAAKDTVDNALCVMGLTPYRKYKKNGEAVFVTASQEDIDVCLNCMRGGCYGYCDKFPSGRGT